MLMSITFLIAEPATISLISLAVGLAGTGVAVYGSVKQGEATAEAAKRSQEAENANAKAAQDAAALEAGQIRRKNLLRLGSQRADAAKSGVLIDNASDVIYDTSIQGELEALSSLYSGNTSAAFSRSRGRNAALEGANAKSASYIQAGGTLIGGLGKATAAYGTYSNRSSTTRSGATNSWQTLP